MYKNPEDKLNPNKTCGKHLFKGFCKDLADMVMADIGEDYEMCLVKDNSYGERLEDGTWNGMIGEVIKQVARQQLRQCYLSIKHIDSFHYVVFIFGHI